VCTHSPAIHILRSHLHLGEHIDYALFGVLPAAVDRDILIACAPRDHSDHTNTAGAVVAENCQSKYPKQEFAPTLKVPKAEEQDEYTEAWFLDIDTTVLRWESYVKAGYYVRPAICPSYLPSRSKQYIS
jgi:galactokinase